LQEESLELRRRLGNKWQIANSLNNLGMIATDQDELDLARVSLEEAIGIQREIGDSSALATALHSLGNTLRAQHEYDRANTLYVESLQINRQLGDRWMIVQLLEDMGWIAALQAQHMRALSLVSAAAAARASLGSPLPPADQAKLDAALAPSRQALGELAQQAWEQGQALDLFAAVAEALEHPM
jgi:tetratricopeptide (TPR) repeat protein